MPGTPTVAAALADMALSAAMIYGGSRLEAGLAVEAEDAVLRWLADAAGFPASAGGTFVSGGSIANLSALVAARGGDAAAHDRRVIVAGASAHSSMAAAAHIMGCELVTAPAADAHGRLTGPSSRRRSQPSTRPAVVAVVATAGATNTGAFDDLAGVAERLRRRRPVAARGRRLRRRRAPLSAHAPAPGRHRARRLVHRRPAQDALHAVRLRRAGLPRLHGGRCSLTQTADYLDPICDAETGNPSDLAVHLTRRVRGVPLWASVLAYGTDAYAAAVDHCVEMAGYAAERIAETPALELVIEPAFTVLLVRRLGWSADDYAAWCEDALARGVAMLMPTRHAGETVLRFCFVNPLTTREDVDLVLAELG